MADLRWHRVAPGRYTALGGRIVLEQEEYGEREWIVVVDNSRAAWFRTKGDAQRWVLALLEAVEEELARTP